MRISTRMPTLFVGHGNPMNALLRNSYTETWSKLGTSLPRPKAVLSVSAHWYIQDAAVTVSTAPRTIHDFGGFPPELYRVQYPAPGDPDLASRVKELLTPLPVRLEERWGLDHGTWAVLCHVYPKADIAIVQLSIDETQPPSFHYEIGKRLALLREEGVLIIGSGNVVHNLHAYAWGRHAQEPYDWTISFEMRVRELLLAGDHNPLVNYETKLGSEAMLAVPTPDHYLPLLYVIGTRIPSEAVSFPVEGVDGGSISMLAVQIG
jgi:4,5-DOPA dioxygenase extradiol